MTFSEIIIWHFGHSHFRFKNDLYGLKLSLSSHQLPLCSFALPSMSSKAQAHRILHAHCITIAFLLVTRTTQAQFFRGYTSPESIKIKHSNISSEETSSIASITENSSSCGNLICEIEQGETTGNCAMDCSCNLDSVCDYWESPDSCPLDCHCGNLICDKELGEDFKNCPQDCTKGCDEMEMDEMGEEMGEMRMDYMDENNMGMSMHHEGDGMDESEDEICKDNGVTCSDNSDCCSFACDSVCVG